MTTPTDLESGLYHDDPDFEGVIDRLSADLFQISSANGKISEVLRKNKRKNKSQPFNSRDAAPCFSSSEESSSAAMKLVQTNQQRFRALKTEIEELQEWRNPTPAQKYSQHKISADFAQLFVEFRSIQEQLLESVRKTSNIKPDNTRNALATQEPERTDFSSGVNFTDTADFQDDAESDPLMGQSLAFEDQLAQDEVSYQQGLVAEREQEIENVAEGMNELNEIYMNLGSIVRDQGVTLDNIEANLYNVAGNIRQGASQLTKAHNWQKRSSGRMLCFLIILLVVAVFLIVAVKI